MRVSLQVRYAIAATFDLAYHTEGQLVQVRVISRRQAIPERFLEQLLRRLRRAGIVTGKRGPGGGYRLARAPEQIDLLQIVEAVEGSLIRPTRRGREEGEGCVPAGPPALAGPEATTGAEHAPSFLWEELAARFARVLQETSLASVCIAASKAGVPRALPVPPMYFI